MEMVSGYPPLSEVRKNLRVNWYRCPIEQERLRELTRRSDLKGWIQTLGHLLLIAATGSGAYILFVHRLWVAFALVLWIHGTVYSFLSGLVAHELSHGTVFATKWLNEFFLRLVCLVSWFNFHHYRRSHTYHHLYTLHPEGDREVVLPNDPTLRIIWAFWLVTIDIPMVAKVVYGTAKLALTGRFGGFHDPEWSEAIFPEEDREGRRKAVNWARLTLLFHLALIAVAVVLHLWALPIVVTFGTFIAEWWKYTIGETMHNGLRDKVADWRKCARSVKLDPFSRFIYWYMNYHIEHHMYAAVPCYNLPKLAKEIAWDMPEARSLRQAWREMYDTWRKQQTDPDYQYDTPVPARRSGTSRSRN